MNKLLKIVYLSNLNLHKDIRSETRKINLKPKLRLA